MECHCMKLRLDVCDYGWTARTDNPVRLYWIRVECFDTRTLIASTTARVIENGSEKYFSQGNLRHILFDCISIRRASSMSSGRLQYQRVASPRSAGSCEQCSSEGLATLELISSTRSGHCEN